MKELIEETIELLEAPLVWSPDFEAIRYHLTALLEAELKSGAAYTATQDICEALLDCFENDLTVG
jgi:hypothetical protein